ncbi:PH domain-containing protein [Streptomyces sp. NPDC096057]|uniref:PH domain-containing protein n=1 Tax=Streptomyces sp. NPDC096057 TaxID=3155543 RepID=UPI00332C21A9
MGQDVHERGVEREYGRQGRAHLVWSGLMVIVAVNTVYQMNRDPNILGDRARPVIDILLLWFLGWALLAGWRRRTFVTADGIAVRGAVRTRHRGWHDIYDIRVEPRRNQRSGDSQWLTYLYGNDGRRLLLPHVDDGQLPQFGAEIDDLRETVARHRGTTWERRPDVEERIRRQSGHRKAWERATSGALLVLLAMFLVTLALVVTGRDTEPLLLLVCVPLAAFALLAALLHWRWKSQVPPPGAGFREPPPTPTAKP